MIVSKVEIYPSLYGLEQMKRDTLYGPPKEVFQIDEGAANKKKKKKPANDADVHVDVDTAVLD